MSNEDHVQTFETSQTLSLSDEGESFDAVTDLIVVGTVVVILHDAIDCNHRSRIEEKSFTREFIMTDWINSRTMAKNFD